MGPSPETCGALLRPLNALLGLKHFAIQRASDYSTDSLPRAAAGLLAELVHSGETRASDLAAYRVVDASVVSRQLSQLEHSGLIVRRPDPEDRRVSFLRATSEGEREIAVLERHKSEWLGQALGEWSDADVSQLAELLENMTADIRRAAHAANDHPDLAKKEVTR